MASTLKMEYQVFFCIFQKNSAMATLGLKEMGKFLEKGLPCWLSQFSIPLYLVFHFEGGRHAALPQKPVVNVDIF